MVVGPEDPVEPVPGSAGPVSVGPVSVGPVSVGPVSAGPVPVGPVASVDSMGVGDMIEPVPVDGKSEVEGPVNPSSHTTSALSSTGLEMKQYSRPSLS